MIRNEPNRLPDRARNGGQRDRTQETANWIWASIAVIVGADEESPHRSLLDGSAEAKCRAVQQELTEAISELDKKARACNRTPKKAPAFLAGALEKRSERLTSDLEKEVADLNTRFHATCRAVRALRTTEARTARQQELAHLKKERNAKQELLCDTWDDIRRLREWLIEGVRERVYQQADSSSVPQSR